MKWFLENYVATTNQIFLTNHSIAVNQQVLFVLQITNLLLFSLRVILYLFLIDNSKQVISYCVILLVTLI